MSGSLRNRFSEQDIIFLLESGDGSLRDKLEIVKNDRAFIESLLEDRALAVLRRITAMGADEMLVTITPRFLFEVLLRAARKEMATRAYTIERTSLERVPVFDTGEVLGFIKDNAILAYLADMLMSFTRIQSYTRPVRVRKGLWRRIRYNDMDVDSLLRFCRTVDEEQRFDLYKRIGDVCLFTLGCFRSTLLREVSAYLPPALRRGPPDVANGYQMIMRQRVEGSTDWPVNITIREVWVWRVFYCDFPRDFTWPGNH